MSIIKYNFMKHFTTIAAFFAALFFFTACGCTHYEEATDIYEDGLLLNDDLVAMRSKEGKLSFKNTASGRTTIRDVDLDWTTPSPHDSLAVFCTDNKRGYYNVYTGEIVVPAQFRRAWIFSEGLAAVQRNGNIGFIDHQGNVVIDFLYPYHGNPLSSFVFEDGHCVVADNQGRCGVIGREGQWLIPPDYDYVSAFSEYAVASRDGVTVQMGYDGTVINAFVLDNIKDLTYNEEETIVTRDGTVLHSMREVKTGLMAYCIGGRYGLIDGRSCKRLTEPLYKNIRAVSKTMFRATLLDYYSEILLNENGDVIK